MAKERGREPGASRFLDRVIAIVTTDRRPGGLARFLEGASLFALTIAIAAADYASGRYLSFSAFYLSVVIVAAALVGTEIAAAVAFLASFAWTGSDILVFHGNAGASQLIWNLLFRMVTLGTGVVLVAALRAALLRAVESERTSRAFLAGAAHQLRTPLSGIQSSVDAMAMAEPGSDADDLLARVGNEVARASRVVASLLRMARLDQGEPLLLRSSRLANVLSEEVQRQSDRCRVGLTFGLHTDETDTDGMMSVDAAVLREAIANVLDNARRHAVHRVEVALVVRDREAEITFWDDGPGIAPMERETIFEPFVSLDGKGGTGVGLTVARGIARGHRGELYYDEERGFVMMLPRTATPSSRRLHTATPTREPRPSYGAAAGPSSAGG